MERLALVKCPKCGAKNPVGTRFCGECGTKLG
ncbi:MAG: zinc-ribbon domain-containing protein [bacterium]